MSLYVKLSTAFPDDPKIIDAGPLAELLYIRCILKCRENLSDGVIDRRRLPRWAAGVTARPTVLAKRLVDVGLWVEHPDGWAMPQWTDEAQRREVRRRRWRVYQCRHEVFERDGHQCVECGSADRLEVDHIMPMAAGGDDELSNLQTLCKPCNASKKDHV